MTTLVVLGLALCGALIVLLALFEIAFFSSSEVAVRVLAEHTDESDSLRQSLGDPLVVLAPSRLGLVLACLAAWLLLTRIAGPVTAAAAPGVLGISYIALREIIPATVLLQDPERVLVRVLPWFRRWERLTDPFTGPLRRGLRHFFPAPVEPDDDATDEEVEAYLAAGEDEGILEEEETEMVRGVLDLDDTVVREVMTPRARVVSLSDRATVGEARKLVGKSRHHRLPVFDDKDRPLGTVNVVDLLAPDPDAAVRSFVQKARVAPETQPVDELLRDFREDRRTFAMVVDEHGSVSGIVTLRDISEEIVGEVREASDDDVVAESGGSFLVRGAAELDEVNRRTGLILPDSLRGAPLDTVAGFVVAAFGRIPQAGEAAEHEAIRIEVVRASERSVDQVRLTRRPDPSTPQ